MTLVERFLRLSISTLCLVALVVLAIEKVDLPTTETGLLGGVGAFALPPLQRDGVITLAERLVRLVLAAAAIAAIVGLAMAAIKLPPMVGGLLGGVAIFALPPVRRDDAPDGWK